MHVTKLLSDFYSATHISQIIIFLCFNDGRNTVIKQLSRVGIQVSIISYAEIENNWEAIIKSTKNVPKIGVVVELACYPSTRFLKWVSTNDIFKHQGYYWLLLEYNEYYSFHLKNNLIENDAVLRYLALSRVAITVAAINGHRKNASVPLYEFHTLLHKNMSRASNVPSKVTKQIIGYWNHNGLNSSGRRHRHGITGVTLNVTSTSHKSIQQNRLKFDQTLLNLLMHIIGFRLHVVHAPHRYKSKDLWTLQQLEKGHVDLGASTVLMTYDRYGLADYTIAVDKFRPHLYYKVQSLRTARNIYILPFSPDVWVSLISLLLAITVALTFILGSETRLPNDMSAASPSSNTAKKANNHTLSTTTQNPSESTVNFSSKSNGVVDTKNDIDAQQQPNWDLSEVMLVTFGAISQQGSARNPTTSAARTLFITLFVLAVLTYTAYSASVISLMSSAQPVVNSLQGILKEDSKMEIALQNNHYYHTQFKDDPNPVSSKLHELEVVPSFLDLNEGLELTVQGCMAFSADKVDAYTYLHGSQQSEASLCSVGVVPLLQGPGYYRAFALKPNSPYTAIINQGLLRLQEHGLLDRERRRWFIIHPLCESIDAHAGSSYISIALDDISPALYLVGCGGLISLALLTLEIAMHYCIIQVKKRYKFPNGHKNWALPISKSYQKTHLKKKSQGVLSQLVSNNKSKSVNWVKEKWNTVKEHVLTSTTQLPFIH